MTIQPLNSFTLHSKKEEVYQTTYPDFEAAKRALFSYIEGWYNQNRILKHNIY